MQLTTFSPTQSLATQIEELKVRAPRGFKDELKKILSIDPTYVWYSENNWILASQTFDSLLRAASQKRTDLIRTSASAIVEVYNRDRAEKASVALQLGEAPITEIPATALVNDTLFHLRTWRFEQWKAEIPTSVLTNFNTLMSQTLPDEIVYAVYEREQRRLPDPLLYARFGSWFVKVGEWE